jgi:phosphoribosyl-ATP pyrophosphohydrolase/phosphoribosyl-AMP cyclohydrolase
MCNMKTPEPPTQFDPQAGASEVARVEDVDFEKSPLIPAIVQDARTGLVLTLAYMNREALARTLELGQTVFWSRSRGELWHKGATSGHVQDVISIRLDCDGDALLVLVHPRGPACHTGATTCFYRLLRDA